MGQQLDSIRLNFMDYAAGMYAMQIHSLEFVALTRQFLLLARERLDQSKDRNVLKVVRFDISSIQGETDWSRRLMKTSPSLGDYHYNAEVIEITRTAWRWREGKNIDNKTYVSVSVLSKIDRNPLEIVRRGTYTTASLKTVAALKPRNKMIKIYLWQLLLRQKKTVDLASINTLLQTVIIVFHSYKQTRILYSRKIMVRRGRLFKLIINHTRKPHKCLRTLCCCQTR